MRYTVIFNASVVFVIGTALAQTQNSSRNADTKPNATSRIGTISVTDFSTRKVIGHLGHPLGTVVRVTGKVVDGDATRMKRNTGRTLLEIHTVNGKKLETNVLFQFQRAAKSVAKPKPGEKFDYYVHEYGSFDGVVVPPRELNIAFPTVAHDGFYYRRQITIHKSLN